MTVEIVDPTNRAPVANADERTVTQGEEIPDFDVVANDFDPDGSRTRCGWSATPKS